MITPDAKCVNNGKKVNEAINAINPLLGMSVGYTAGGTPPQVTYSDTEVKILLPLADSVEGFSLEELDVVDSNNAASSRYFMTSLSSVSTYGTTTTTTSGTPTGKQSSPQPTTGRNKLDAGGNNADNNRDKLNTGGALLDNSGGGVAPNGIIGGGGPLRNDGKTSGGGGGPLRNDGKTSVGGGGALRDDGTTTAGGGINSLNGVVGGSLRDDGTTTAGGGINSLNKAGGVDNSVFNNTSEPTNETKAQPPTSPALNNRIKPDGSPITEADLKSGQWLPSRNGTLDLPELKKWLIQGRPHRGKLTIFAKWAVKIPKKLTQRRQQQLLMTCRKRRPTRGEENHKAIK